MIARFVCLLPFPLSLKLVSNKHFHTTQKSEVVNKALLENIGKTNFSSNLLFSPEYFLDDYNDGVALGEASANRVL